MPSEDRITLLSMAVGPARPNAPNNSDRTRPSVRDPYTKIAMHRKILAYVLLLGLLPSSPVRAQEAHLAVQEPPYYIGEPVVVRITVEGLDEEPLPIVTAAPADASLKVRLQPFQPSVSSSMQIVTDAAGRRRITEATEVVYTIDHHVIASRPGKFSVGPFEIVQGKKKLETGSVDLEFNDVPASPDLRIDLRLADQPVYPDQRVPVTVELWYAGEFQDVDRLHIGSPLFDQFRFGPDPKPNRNSSMLPLDTKEGQVVLPATVRREADGDQTFTVVSAERTLIPDRAGVFELEPIAVTIRRVTRWARDRDPLEDLGFGSSLLRDVMGDRRRPAKTELLRAAGKPLQLEVKPFPSEGRPESFVGAVGDGFSLEVAADRTVVRVGDPITLQVRLRGGGNLENASLPALSADGGLDPAKFRLPEEEIAGELRDGVKQFAVTVRVQDESVAELPALAYSWFDPQTEEYHTTRSKPIALRVMPARIVSAADVVSQAAPANGEPARPAGAGSPPDAPTHSSRPSFTLTGADLSIGLDTASLLRATGRRRADWIVEISLYAVGVLLWAVALLDRRRSLVDPALAHRKRVFKEQRSRISRARGDAPQTAAQQVAAALRALVAEVPDADRAEIQRVIADCESLVYAPTGTGNAGLIDSLVARALAATDRLSGDAA